MFERIRQFFDDLAAAEPEDLAADYSLDDTRVATAALLVHIVAIDGEISDEERNALRRVLSGHFAIDADETEHLIAAAQAQDEAAVDFYRFTSVLKGRLDAKGREDVIEMLLELVFADGVVHEFEDNMVWRVAELIGVDTRTRVTIRKRVAARLGHGNGNGEARS